jgi:hypothetical protein
LFRCPSVDSTIQNLAAAAEIGLEGGGDGLGLEGQLKYKAEFYKFYK